MGICSCRSYSKQARARPAPRSPLIERLIAFQNSIVYKIVHIISSSTRTDLTPRNLRTVYESRPAHHQHQLAWSCWAASVRTLQNVEAALLPASHEHMYRCGAVLSAQTSLMREVEAILICGARPHCNSQVVSVRRP